ncbi:MAG: hypothetical protein EBZ14_06165 [Gammaproteobacteria bacterium]|nr:hypothetical protein [Gammaproteobacteria bacterium]
MAKFFEHAAARIHEALTIGGVDLGAGAAGLVQATTNLKVRKADERFDPLWQEYRKRGVLGEQSEHDGRSVSIGNPFLVEETSALPVGARRWSRGERFHRGLL